MQYGQPVAGLPQAQPSGNEAFVDQLGLGGLANNPVGRVALSGGLDYMYSKVDRKLRSPRRTSRLT